MLAYHNDPELKKTVIAEIAAHREADSLIQGYGYWKDGKGCAVGCLIKSDDHKMYEIRFGIPESLALLEDAIFEWLPTDDARKWPERFLNAIRPGADLSKVWSHFAYWMLMNKKYGQIVYAGNDQSVKDAIMGIAKLHKEVTQGKQKNVEAEESAAWSAARLAAESAAKSAAWLAAESAAWSAAESAAKSAARSAAELAAESAAESAARSAAWSAARLAAGSAARSAAESAAWSATWSAAESAAYKRMANKLIELLEAA
jgi:hypothetical protein